MVENVRTLVDTCKYEINGVRILFRAVRWHMSVIGVCALTRWYIRETSRKWICGAVNTINCARNYIKLFAERDITKYVCVWYTKVEQ